MKKVIKTLRMSEFNQFLQEVRAYFKPSPGAKAKHFKHYATAVTEQH